MLPTDEAGWLAGDTRRKTTPVPGVRALCARARQSRAVFRLPVGDASEIKAAVPPPSAFPVRLRRLAGRGIAPAARRLVGCCRLVRSSVAGRRRLWPQANRRRRWGSRGHSPLRFLFPISCPYKKWGRLPGRDPAISAAEGGTYKAPRRSANKSPPPTGRKSLRDRRRSTTGKLRRSVSGKSKAAAGGNRRIEPHSERQNRIRGEPRANKAHTMTETRQNRWER